MLRLVKLTLLALVGYALYEFARGFFNEELSFAVEQGDDLDRALNSDDGRMQTLTGEGRGHREATLDRNGMSIPHQVGRGVTHTQT